MHYCSQLAGRACEAVDAASAARSMAMVSMITISAFEWVPDFARDQVRDLRVRWALEEAGLQYQTRLLTFGDQDKPEYRALQPFGQVPIMDGDGVVLFEIRRHLAAHRRKERSSAAKRSRRPGPRHAMADRGAF